LLVEHCEVVFLPDVRRHVAVLVEIELRSRVGIGVLVQHRVVDAHHVAIFVVHVVGIRLAAHFVVVGGVVAVHLHVVRHRVILVAIVGRSGRRCRYRLTAVVGVIQQFELVVGGTDDIAINLRHGAGPRPTGSVRYNAWSACGCVAVVVVVVAGRLDVVECGEVVVVIEAVAGVVGHVHVGQIAHVHAVHVVIVGVERILLKPCGGGEGWEEALVLVGFRLQLKWIEEATLVVVAAIVHVVVVGTRRIVGVEHVVHVVHVLRAHVVERDIALVVVWQVVATCGGSTWRQVVAWRLKGVDNRVVIVIKC